MRQQPRNPQLHTNIEEDSIAKSGPTKHDQALSPQTNSHDSQKQNRTLDSTPPPELTNDSHNDNKIPLHARSWTPESLESRFSPCGPRSATEYTRVQDGIAHDCTKQGHQPRVIYPTHSPPYSAEVGRLDTTAKLPNISWLPVFSSRDLVATKNTAAMTDTAATTTNTTERTSFVICDICGQFLPSVPPKVAYRGGQTQVIRYNHQVFRRDFVRARQSPHRIREMARATEEEMGVKTGKE